MERFLQIETLIIALLLLASLVAVAVQRFRVPYTVALVVVGLLITFRQPFQLEAPPEIIPALFLPPLVFRAAFRLNLSELRHNQFNILAMAVPSVLASTLIVGGLLAWAVPLAWPVALVFGSLIAATDPMAVVSLFRRLGVPKRLAILVEGESLFNNGTAIVIFNLTLATALTGQFHVLTGIINFVQVAASGIIIGLVLGWLTAQVIARVDDYLIQITLTMVLAFGAYLMAERFNVSGALAVMMAGLITSNFGRQDISPTTRLVLSNFWEYVAFLASLLVFLLIGLRVNLSALAVAWQPIGWAILAVLVSRAIGVYGLTALTNGLIKRVRRITAEPTPMNWQHVMNWGGLRGAIGLALALSLPDALGPDRALLHMMALGVVLFTLLFQGLTIGTVVRWLRIGAHHEETRREYETRRARLNAVRAAEAHLNVLHRMGLLSTPTRNALKRELANRVHSLEDFVDEALKADPDLEAEELDTARREMLRAKQKALLDMLRTGVISEDIYVRLSTEVEAELNESSALET